MRGQTPVPLGPLAQEAGEMRGDEMEPRARMKIPQ